MLRNYAKCVIMPGMIIGVDEVGRGCLAGPMCVAAVAWPKSAPINGLADSKKLNAIQRQKMNKIIRDHAVEIGIGWVTARQIDEMGVTAALQFAAQKAVKQINIDAQVIVDGRDKLLGDIKADYVIKADGTVPAVMAASIIAKVARDTYMKALGKVFIGYKFEQHVGYGTAAHRAAIKELGPCEHHRFSYGLLKEYAR